MDRKKILEEGFLELYILGSLSEKEEAQLEAILVKDAELREQLSDLEADFEQIALENAVEPPARIKERLRSILDSETSSNEFTKDKIPQSNNTVLSTRLLVAASLAALFALGSFWLYLQWQTSLNDFRTLEVQTVELQERISEMERKYESTRERYITISDPETIPFYLVGNQISPGSKAVAYVNHEDRIVVVNGLGLKPLAKGQIYQMWADVEGEMINMGLVPPEQDYVALRYIDKAESLNITIEPAGGSEHPTVENLISNIYL